MDLHQRLLDRFFELVKIDAPTRKEDKIAAFLKQELIALGCEVKEDNAGELIGGTANNIFANLKGTHPNSANLPTIMLSAHMDGVSPCEGIEPQLIDGVITSKGDTILGSDDKSGVVAILEGIRRLQEANEPYCNIQIVFTVAEEGGVNGSKNMDKSLLNADFGYVLDSSGAPGQMVYAAPGINKFKVTLHGKAAHAGIAPENGLNAIYVLSQALVNFPQGRRDEETTANIGPIKGGSATNVVVDLVEVTCEARSLIAEKLEIISNDIVKAFEDAAKANNTTVEIEVIPSYGGYKLDHDLPLIKIAKEAAEALNLPVELKRSGGGSDANNINNYGVPCIPLATGMTNVHTKDEYILEEHLEQITQWVSEILKTACK